MRNFGTGQTRTALTGVLAALLFAAQPLAAAPAGFDLDLKELKKPAAPLPVARKVAPPKQEKVVAQPATAKPIVKKSKPTTVKTAKKPAEPTVKQVAAQQTGSTAAPESSYTVVAGDTLYGILTRQYGLGTDAANRLMPVVVQQNKLAGVASLTAGQKLLIPLAAPPTTPATVALPVVVAAVPTTVTTPVERMVLLDAATACPLARQVMEAVAQPVDPRELLQDAALPAVSAARHEGIIALLACGLPRAEEYTYRRLLEMQGTQLVSLSGDDPLPQAVHTVLDALGLSYQRLTGTHGSYLVRQTDSSDQMIRLTIRSANASPDVSVR